MKVLMISIRIRMRMRMKRETWWRIDTNKQTRRHTKP